MIRDGVGHNLLVLRYQRDLKCMVHRRSYRMESISTHTGKSEIYVDENSWDIDTLHFGQGVVVFKSDENKPYVHNRNGIIVEDSGHVFGREFVRRIAYEQACFPNRTVANHNASIAEESAFGCESRSRSTTYLMVATTMMVDSGCLWKT